MAFTFLVVRGYAVGRSRAEGDPATARDYLEKAAASGIHLDPPVDIVAASRRAASAVAEVVRSRAIPSDKMGLDIGPETARLFADAIARAKTIFCKGPMGVFELSPFAAGTRAVAQALADSNAFTMIGGVDTAVHPMLAGELNWVGIAISARISHVRPPGRPPCSPALAPIGRRRTDVAEPHNPWSRTRPRRGLLIVKTLG